MNEELARVDNPYGRLAWLIDDYLRRLRNPDSSPIFQELFSYRVISRYANNREEQVRYYCELTCSSFPTILVEKFHDDYLYRYIQEFMDPEPDESDDSQRDDADIGFIEEITREERVVEVCNWLGFTRPRPVKKGIHYRIGHLRDSLDKLAGSSISRQEIKGCGLDAHDTALEILKELLSFWGRYLWEDNQAYLDKLIQDIGLSNRKAKKLQEWRDPDKDYRLDLSDLVNLYQCWNDAINSPLNPLDVEWLGKLKTALGERLEEVSGERKYLLFPDLLDYLDTIRFGRKEFAHAHAPEEIELKLGDYRQLASNDLEISLAFATQIQGDVFPAIIIMQRYLLLETGIVRLDYLDEFGNLQHKRFLNFLIDDFQPKVPMYYYQPMTKEEQANPTVLSSPPIFIPVDENR